MAKRDIIVIGASAGGVHALRELVSTLSPEFAASIFIVLHVSPTAPSYMPQILTECGPLSAVHPNDGDEILPGHIYIAPPNHHLLIEEDRIIVKYGPKENRFRPSIDALFRSAAYTYGPRVVGVVLTGMLDDGTSGMWSVKRLGGVCVVQDSGDAMYASMPNSVMEYVDVDYAVPIAKMAALLEDLINEPIADKPTLPPHEEQLLQTEINIAAQGNAFDMRILDMGDFTPLTCPECSGALVSIREGKLVRYRCHTGHAYTASSLLAEVTKTVEASLWKAIRSLEESVILLEESGKQLVAGGNIEAAELFFQQAAQARERSQQAHEFAYRQSQVSRNGLIAQSQAPTPTP